MVKCNQQTVSWNVDDVKSSHFDPKVKDEFCKLLESKYGDPKIAKFKANRRSTHEYIGMKLDYSKPVIVEIDMKRNIEEMMKEFPDTKTTNKCPWDEDLFQVKPNTKLT
jgi:hypothetical protein